MKKILKETKIGRLLNKKNIYLSKIKRKIFKHVLLARLIILSVCAVLIASLFVASGRLFEYLGVGYYLGLANDILSANESSVKQVDNRTNILIMGKSGGSHEGPDLTDTIIFASLSQKDNTITLISLSRDIWLQDFRAKLNSAYYWGNKKEKGGGLILAKSAVEKILDQPIQYAVVIDFSGFEKIINTLGGINVDVRRGFTDEWFPIPGKENDICNGDLEYRCRYETITFASGRQYMDGTTALKYVRSRHAEGDEGTDFAREARQQEVIRAIKEKLLDQSTLLSKEKVTALLSVVVENVETDIDKDTANALVRLIYKSRNNIKSHVLPGELLYNPPYSAKYDNLYIFLPKDGSWKTIQEWVICIEERQMCFPEPEK